MRNITLYFTFTLLSFGIGITSTMLATSLHPSGIYRVDVTNQPPDTHLERADVRFVSILGEVRAAPIAETVEKLRKIETEEFDTNIPPAAKPLLTRLKHQLRDLVAETVNTESMRGETPEHLQAAILAQLESAGVTVQMPEDVVYSEDYFQKPYVYGDIFEINVERPTNHPELLVATTTLGICCGEDTSLYLFEMKGNQWALVLAQEANDYNEVNGAQGRFSYAVSPTDARNHFFVVTANVNPWCTSNWQSLRYEVLRIGSNAYQPHIILNDKDTIFLGEEPPYQLHVEEDAFTLSFASDEFMDRLNNGEELSQEEIANSRIVKYLIDGDKAMRVRGSKSKAHDEASNERP